MCESALGAAEICSSHSFELNAWDLFLGRSLGTSHLEDQ